MRKSNAALALRSCSRTRPALLRLISAVLMEINEEWETEKIYLRMENNGLITQEK